MPACAGKGEIVCFYLFGRWVLVCAGTVVVGFAL
jgi:hypothetical protein